MNGFELFDVTEPGKFYSFYGCDNNLFKLGEIVFEAVEDPDDGYRSYLDCVISKKSDAGIFPNRILANVQIKQDSSDDEIHNLIDKDGHIWLTFGADRNDAYYPYFVFRYTPKETQKEYETMLCPLKLHPERFL